MNAFEVEKDTLIGDCRHLIEMGKWGIWCVFVPFKGISSDFGRSDSINQNYRGDLHIAQINHATHSAHTDWRQLLRRTLYH